MLKSSSAIEDLRKLLLEGHYTIFEKAFELKALTFVGRHHNHMLCADIIIKI